MTAKQDGKRLGVPETFVHDSLDDDECYECGGEGWITADCDEDACCCADPEEQHGVEPYPLCNPKGLR